MEWDFTLPGASDVDALGAAVAKVAPVVWEDEDRFKADNFRPMPSVDDALMVYCIGCGEPMPLVEAIGHGGDLPPAGML